MKGCMELLLKFAPRNDIMGTTARRRLGAALDSLILRGFIDLAEILVQQVAPMEKGWPYGLRTLNGVLLFHNEDLEAKDLSRVQDLAEQLQPRDLQDRVKILVTEVPMPDAVQGGTDGLQVYETRLAIVEDLAKELLREQTILSRVLPDLCRGPQSMADDLGKAVAEAAYQPLEWFDIVQQATMGVSSDSFNPDFLVGFLHGLKKSHPETVDDFKQKMAGDVQTGTRSPPNLFAARHCRVRFSTRDWRFSGRYVAPLAIGTVGNAWGPVRNPNFQHCLFPRFAHRP